MFHVIRNYIDSPLQHLNFGCHLVVTLMGGHFNDIQFQREITIFATNFRVIENTLVVYYNNVAVLAIRLTEKRKRKFLPQFSVSGLILYSVMLLSFGIR